MTEDWFKKVKRGATVALQTNDFHDIVEHINTVNNLKELRKNTQCQKFILEQKTVTDIIGLCSGYKIMCNAIYIIAYHGSRDNVRLERKEAIITMLR